MTDRDADPPRGLLGRLRELLELLAEMEREGESTRRGSGNQDAGPAHISFDYGVDIGGLGDRPPGPGDRPPGGDGQDAGADDGPGDDPAIAVREADDGRVVVTVDLPAGVGDDASVAVDRATSELTVSVDGDAIAAVPLDDENYEVVAADVNNRVLEIALRRSEGAS